MKCITCTTYKKADNCQKCFTVMVKDLREGLEIVKYLKTLYLDVFVQPFRDYDNMEPPEEIKRFARFVNVKSVFKSITWSEYGRRIQKAYAQHYFM